MSENQMLETALRCLDRALGAMNRAIELTTDQGPAVAIEYIADFLNNTDGIDEHVADVTPDDWLTRWQVVKASESGPGQLLGEPDDEDADCPIGSAPCVLPAGHDGGHVFVSSVAR